MNNYYDQLIARKQELNSAIEKAKKVVESSPDGRLRIAQTSSGTRFFHVTDKTKHCGKYIPMSNKELIGKLSNKGYAEKLIRTAKSELGDINRLLNRKTYGRPEEVYTELSETRKQYINPILMNDNAFASLWKNKEFRTGKYMEDDKVYETDLHEFVRSKSEMDIANLMNQMGIPYAYEAELVLPNGNVKYPDFTILKTCTREVFYYEHFGLMDDSGYRRNCFQKISEYAENGIIMGKNLLCTFEAQGSPLNMKIIRRMLKTVILQ